MADAKIVIGAKDETAAAFAAAKARLAGLGQAGAALNDKLVAIGAAVGGAFAAAGLKQFISGIAEGLDKLNDLADATGSSIEKLSALEDTAARTGTSLETVGSSLVKLNKTIADAKPGSDAENALKAIGTSAKELRDLDPADALLRVAQGLAQFKDDGNKARLTQELFGKSLREVAPLLKDLNEKGQLNATVTTEQAAAAEKFRQNSAALAKNLTDLARAMVSDLVPALNEISKAFSEGGLKAGFDKLGNLAFDWTNSQGRKEIKRLTADLEELEKKASVVDASFLDKIKKLGSAGAVGLTASGATAQTLAAEMDAAKARIEALTQQLLDSMRPPARTGVGGPAGDKPTAPVVGDAAAAAEIEKRFEAQLARLHDAIRATAQLTEVEKLEIAVAERSAELKGFNARKLETLIGLTRTMEEVTGKAAEARLRRDRQNQQGPGEDGQNLIVNVDALAAQSKAAQIELLAQQIASVRDQMSGASGSNITRFKRALDVLDERMKSLQDNTKGLSEKLNQFSEDLKELAGGIQDALGASLGAVLEGNLGKIDRIWGTFIKNLILKAQTARLMETLFGKSFVSSGELGGLFGGLFAGGSSASGGTEGQFVGDVFKNVVTGTSKTSGAVVINYGGLSFGSGVSRNEVLAAMNTATARAKADIADAQRRGRGQQ